MSLERLNHKLALEVSVRGDGLFIASGDFPTILPGGLTRLIDGPDPDVSLGLTGKTGTDTFVRPRVGPDAPAGASFFGATRQFARRVAEEG